MPSHEVRLEQVHPPEPSTETDTDIDIIAVHGLDTQSPETWTWRPDNPKDGPVNWLQDPRMLPAVEPRARIFTCDWPAGLFHPSDLVQKTIDEYALLLLDGIKRRLSAAPSATGVDDRPLFFIASCLGGIILIKALVMADDKQNSCHHLLKATRGIVFLATPFRGTSFRDVAAWAEPGLRAWAWAKSRETIRLLDSLKESTFALEALVREFTQLCREDNQACHVFTFYELGMTSLPSKVIPLLPPSWLGQVKQASFP